MVGDRHVWWGSSPAHRVLGLGLIALALGCTETKTRTPESGSPCDTAVIPDTGVPADALAMAPDTSDPGPGDVTLEGDTRSPVDVSDTDAPLEDTVEDVAVVPDDLGGADAADVAAIPALPDRACLYRFTVASEAASVHVAGEFNDWSTTALPLVSDGQGVYSADLDTTGLAGSYAYKLVFNGNDWQLDGAEPMRKIVGGVENSKVLLPDCRLPLLELETLEVSADHLRVVVAVRRGSGGAALEGERVERGGVLYDGATWDAQSQRFTLDVKSPAAGKWGLTFRIRNGAGEAVPLHLPIWVEAQAFDWRDAVLYFAMTDRFLDGDPSSSSADACLPNGNKANWLGGDWKGVRQRVEDGYFDSLGVNALWLTAVVDNPDGCETGAADGRQYTSYHGYFPSSQLDPEPRLGTLAELRQLVAAAHARGIRVLVDLVANHLHETHPLVSEHTADGWFNSFVTCQDGGFDNAPLNCWFEPYLPDLDYTNDAVVEAMTDMAVEWVLAADLDGFRVDAVKHMHPNFLRTLTAKLGRVAETVPGARFYLVGETFTGEWGGGQGPNETLIKSYVNPTLLDGQFDFPLYWNIVKAFARGELGLGDLGNITLAAQGYYGPFAVMSSFAGNHDVPRLLSHAAGQIGDVWGNGSKDQGWNAPPSQPTQLEPYERAALALGFLFTAPGVPLLYYGDEVGLVGAGDPDNRRLMPWDGYSAGQLLVRERVQAFGAARRKLAALRRGDFQLVQGSADLLVFRRTLGAEVVTVALNRAAAPASVSIPSAVSLTDQITLGSKAPSGGTVTFDVPPRGMVILIP